MNKRVLIILIIIALVILSVIFLVVSGGRGTRAPTDPGSVVTKDKDTGDTIVNDKTKVTEAQNSGFVAIYGGDKVYNVMSNAQYSLLRESISFFVKSDIDTKINTVKVLPETIKANDTFVNFTLKTVDPEKSILIKALLYNGQSIKITYIDPATSAVLYDTGYLPENPTDIPTGD